MPHRYRWAFLLSISCYFYLVFKPEYILILFFTILIDYWAAIWIEKAEGTRRKALLVVSLISNIGVLAIFKYYNFFNTNIESFLRLFSIHDPIPFLDIVLPIGLSFHTFQAMSYTIEVYRGNQKVEKNLGIYSLYVMFYPQLVAGPIERPQNMLHQFYEEHFPDFERIKAGLMRMCWGFFKKVVIADRLAMVVNESYNHVSDSSGKTLLVSTFFFTFQIYCDFSGYSDIALGAASVLGFDMMENFRSPYFSRSVSEFWSRWHISLSTWFRDYLYIPLGGNRVSLSRWYFNLLFVFIVSGFWHGANWTYIAWGLLHGLYLVIAIMKDKAFEKMNLKFTPTMWLSAVNMLFTFVLVMLTWVFFRASTITDATIIFKKIFTIQSNEIAVFALNKWEMYFSLVLIILLLLKEKWIPVIPTRNTWFFGVLFLGLCFITYLFGVFNFTQFIYFQF